MQQQLDKLMKAIITPEGEKVVVVEWPTGAGFVLGRDDALGFAFMMLATVRNLYDSVDELNASLQGVLNATVPPSPARKTVQ